MSRISEDSYAFITKDGYDHPAIVMLEGEYKGVAWGYTSVSIPKINTTEALRNGYLHFADCIQKRVQPRTNLQRARKILSWVL